MDAAADDRGVVGQSRLRRVLEPTDTIAAEWVRACADTGLSAPDARSIVDVLTEAMTAEAGDVDWRLILSTGAFAVPTVSQLRQLRGLLFHRASAQGLEGVRPYIDLFLDDLTDKAIEHRLRILEREALTDPLTGLGNRRAFERTINSELARRSRRGEELALVLIDLDGLKVINDDIGHEAGDHALQGLAAALESAVRLSDSVHRIGGDEFLVLLPDTSAPGADEVVARARKRAPAFTYGIAVAPSDGTTADELIETADRMLLDRKRHRPDHQIRGEVIAFERGARRGQEPSAEQQVPPLHVQPLADEGRLVVKEVITVSERDRFSVEVVLACGDDQRRGAATSVPVASARLRAVGEATLEALVALDIARSPIYLTAAEICRCTGVEVAAASVLSLVGAAERTSSGIGRVDDGATEGVIAAVIEAVTRLGGATAPAAEKTPPTAASAGEGGHGHRRS